MNFGSVTEKKKKITLQKLLPKLYTEFCIQALIIVGFYSTYIVKKQIADIVVSANKTTENRIK